MPRVFLLTDRDLQRLAKPSSWKRNALFFVAGFGLGQLIIALVRWL